MIQYRLSVKNPASQFLEIQISIPISFPGTIRLQLPIWRAGRYQVANYAQFIRNFKVLNEEKEVVPFSKRSKSMWEVVADKTGKYTVSYQFFAGQMDAGSSWIDEEQVYLNLVNCCMEVFGTKVQAYEIKTYFPYPVRVFTLKKDTSGKHITSDFQEIADATILASNSVNHEKFVISDITFHCWMQGDVLFNKNYFIEALIKIAETQIRDFESFPESEYHFIYQFLPYRHYHGVEHRRGTVITYGPSEKLKNNESMMELIGVSSHELYHAWNVCRIRPKDLLPYDFGKENHTESGWILEGITSYMGDLYLLKSGVISLSDYIQKIQNTIQRVSEDFGWRNLNILESSFETWLDGYQKGIPDRKQNIYSNGALIAFALDLSLHSFGSSLVEVMKLAWNKFGKNYRGYTENSFWKLVMRSAPRFDANNFYSQFIYGKNSPIPALEKLLPLLGLELKADENTDFLRNELGLLVDGQVVKKIHPDSYAYQILMLEDQIENITKDGTLEIRRINGNTYQFKIKKSSERYFPAYTIKIGPDSEMRSRWMN